MEVIESFGLVLEHLKNGEIVLLADRTSFYYQNKNVIVHAPNSHYTMTLKMFKTLFYDQTFYLYRPSEEAFDPEKDDAYYAWKARGIN